MGSPTPPALSLPGTADLFAIPNLRHLRIIDAVARNSSISQAATEVNLSQPAVTQAIAKLEAEVGRPLFERNHNGSFLTEAGTVFLERVRRFLGQSDLALAGIAPRGSRPITVSQITTTQMRSLVAIAMNPVLSQAAAAIDVSPATLKRAARDLEANLRVALFRPSKFGLALTEEGTACAQGMGLAFREIEAVADDLRQLDGKLGGRISIGTLPMSGAFVIGEAIADLTKKFPEAHVSVTNAPYSMLVNSLMFGEIDMIFGMLRGVDCLPGLTEEHLFSDPFCIIGRADHPLARRREVSRAELMEYDWIVPAGGSPRRERFEKLFEGSGQPRVSIEMASIPAIQAVLLRTDDLTMVNRREIERDRRFGVVSVLNYETTLPPMVKGVTTRRNWLMTPIQGRFIDLLRQRARVVSATAVARESA